MKLLTVVTSYRNRPEDLKRFDNDIHLQRAIDYLLVEQDNNGLFNTGKLHNIAVREAKTKFVLKKDIDCTMSLQSMKNLLKLLKKADDTFFMNIGIGGSKWGCQWCCSRETYLKVGGEPEWPGFFGEDYGILCKLKKHLDPQFKLEYNERTLCRQIAEHIARPMNREAEEKGIYMIHHDHPVRPKEELKQASKNFDKLYQLCGKLW